MLLVAFVAFVAWALRRRVGALIDLRLLRNWSLASASLLLFLSGITLYGVMLLMPLYFQEVRGTTVLQAGLLLIPQGVGTLASQSMSGRLSDTSGAAVTGAFQQSFWWVIGFTAVGVLISCALPGRPPPPPEPIPVTAGVTAVPAG